MKRVGGKPAIYLGTILIIMSVGLFSICYYSTSCNKINDPELKTATLLSNQILQSLHLKNAAIISVGCDSIAECDLSGYYINPSPKEKEKDVTSTNELYLLSDHKYIHRSSGCNGVAWADFGTWAFIDGYVELKPDSDSSAVYHGDRMLPLRLAFSTDTKYYLIDTERGYNLFNKLVRLGEPDEALYSSSYERQTDIDSMVLPVLPSIGAIEMCDRFVIN